jgi:hypothetical protein
MAGRSPGGSLNVTVADSVASNNSLDGIKAISGVGAAATQVTVCNFVVKNNGTGLDTVSALLRVAHSVVTGNFVGVGVGSVDTLDSCGDNDIDGNGNDNTGVLLTIPTH